MMDRFSRLFSKKGWGKKRLFAAGFLALAILLCMGASIAFFTDSSSIHAGWRAGSVQVETLEEEDGMSIGQIRVRSSGSTECYVRMRADIPTISWKVLKNLRWTTKQVAIRLPGEESSITADDWQKLEEIPTVVVSRDGTRQEASWIRQEDGFWYLDKSMEYGDEAVLIEELDYPELSQELLQELSQKLQGVNAEMLTVPVVSEAVQARNLSAGEDGSLAAVEAFRIVQEGK